MAHRTPPRNSNRCECGSPKRFSAQACDRCVYLDGSSASDFELIQLLRETSDGMTAKSLAAELGRETANLYPHLNRLAARGRVIKLADAEGGGDEESRGRPSFLYRLVDTGVAA